MAGLSACPAIDMITTNEDCEAAFNEIAIEGYTFYSPGISAADQTPGCSWSSNTSDMTFNSDLNAVNTSNSYIGGLCRVGGSPASVY
jgi:hypothetical protein